MIILSQKLDDVLMSSCLIRNTSLGSCSGATLILQNL